MGNDTHIRQRAADTLEQLCEVYRVYLEENQEQQPSPNILSRLFGGWFASSDPQKMEPVHREFLQAVENIAGQLAELLEQLKRDHTDLCQAYAQRAISIMLVPKTEKEKLAAEWYMTAAEYQSAMLLPYLSRFELRRVRDGMLKRTPKRLMYPKEKELLEQIEFHLESYR